MVSERLGKDRVFMMGLGGRGAMLFYLIDPYAALDKQSLTAHRFDSSGSAVAQVCHQFDWHKINPGIRSITGVDRHDNHRKGQMNMVLPFLLGISAMTLSTSPLFRPMR
jgi:nucleoside phosphorylase